MTELNKAENNLSTDLNQLTVEIKFYVNQWGQNTIEIGKRLIAAKKLVAQGEWLNWLEKNFNLTIRTADRFMKCAERFGNWTTSSNLKPSQMFELLALPTEETEKFIAEKASEGKSVEDMKIKNLREEVAAWKSDYEKKKSEVENLFYEIESYKEKISAAELDRDGARAAHKIANEQSLKLYEENQQLLEEKNSLQEQLKNQKPQVIEKIVEKIPDDYTDTKFDLSVALSKVDEFQTQLGKAMKNVEKLKKTNERLERKQYTLQKNSCRRLQTFSS